MPKAYCAQCGAPIRIIRNSAGQWQHGHCAFHQFSLRMPEGFIARAFASLRQRVEAAPDMTKYDWRRNNPRITNDQNQTPPPQPLGALLPPS